MELRQLRYFVAVADSLNFTKAAKKLLIAQPSLSQQINTLENQLGFKLFERDRHSVVLTNAGKLFLHDVNDILVKIDRSVERAHDASKGVVGHLNIGFLNAAAKNFLPKLIKLYKKQYPDVNVKLNYYQPKELLDKIKTDQIDLAFTISAGLHDIGDIETRTLFTPANYVVVYEEHDLAGRKEVHLKELMNEPFIMIERESSPQSYDQWLALFIKQGYTPHVVKHTGNFDTILTFVEAGEGIAILPHYLKPLSDDSVKFIKIKGDSHYFEIVAAWKKNTYKINPALTLLLEKIDQIKIG